MECNWAELAFKQRDYIQKIKRDVEILAHDPCMIWPKQRATLDTAPVILILFKDCEAVQAFCGHIHYVVLSEEKVAVCESCIGQEENREWRIVDEDEVARLVIKHTNGLLEYFERMAEGENG